MSKKKVITKTTKKTTKDPTPTGGATSKKIVRPKDPTGWGFPRGSGHDGKAAAIGRHRVHDIKTIAKALANNNGIKKYAADELGIRRQTLSDYIDRFPQIWEAYLEAREVMLDKAEHNFFRIVEQPSHPSHFAALRFFLETVGRGRGYNTRIEFDMRAGEKNIGGELDLDRLTLAQAKQFKNLLEIATVSSQSEFADFEVMADNE